LLITWEAASTAMVSVETRVLSQSKKMVVIGGVGGMVEGVEGMVGTWMDADEGSIVCLRWDT